MIRINLLGQARPKAAKQSVPLESTLQIVLGIGAVAVGLRVTLLDGRVLRGEADGIDVNLDLRLLFLGERLGVGCFDGGTATAATVRPATVSAPKARSE